MPGSPCRSPWSRSPRSPCAVRTGEDRLALRQRSRSSRTWTDRGLGAVGELLDHRPWRSTSRSRSSPGPSPRSRLHAPRLPPPGRPGPRRPRARSDPLGLPRRRPRVLEHRRLAGRHLELLAPRPEHTCAGRAGFHPSRPSSITPPSAVEHLLASHWPIACVINPSLTARGGCRPTPRAPEHRRAAFARTRSFSVGSIRCGPPAGAIPRDATEGPGAVQPGLAVHVGVVIGVRIERGVRFPCFGVLAEELVNISFHAAACTTAVGSPHRPCRTGRR